jgi:hypothetical protein
MTAHRSTYIPPKPRTWPILAGLTIAVLLTGAAFFCALPALYLLAYVLLAVATGQLWRCMQWGIHAMNDIEGAFR